MIKRVINKENYLSIYRFIKNYKFEISIILLIAYFIIKNKILTAALAIPTNYIPLDGDSRKELLTGYLLTKDPFFLGGAYSGSLQNYHPGPIPYNYPSALGWYFSELFEKYNLSQFYITYNIIYLLSITTILITGLVIYKIYNLKITFIYILLAVMTFIFNNGYQYTVGFPTRFNPGNMIITSILVIFLLLASLKKVTPVYTYLLIFFSGLLFQTHLSSSLFTIIILIYSVTTLHRKYNVNYLLFFLAFTPWLQMIIRAITKYSDIINTLEYLKFRAKTQDLSISSLYQQIPFQSIITNLNLNQNTINYINILAITFILLTPIIIYFIFKKENKVHSNKVIIILSFSFLFDILINIIISKESQQHNHLAAYTFFSTFFIIKMVISNIKNISIQKIMILLTFILAILFNNSKNILPHDNNYYLTKSTISKIKAQPVKLEYYDHYNLIASGYLDLTYELLINDIDLCISKPNLKDLNSLYNNKYLQTYISNLGYIKKLYCTQKQNKESDRKALYLLEDATMTINDTFLDAKLLARIPNYNNRNCAKDYHKLTTINNKKDDLCGAFNNYPPIIDQSLYLQNNNKEKMNNKEYISLIDSSILSGKENYNNQPTSSNCINTCQAHYININNQINTFVEIYNYINNNINNTIITNKNNLIDNIINNYNSEYSTLRYNNNLSEEKNEYKKIGNFIFKYKDTINSEKIYLSPLNNIELTNFNCSIELFQKEKLFLTTLPRCKNNDAFITDEINNKIKEKIISAKIYKIIYDKKNITNRKLIISELVGKIESTTNDFNDDLLSNIKIEKVNKEESLDNRYFSQNYNFPKNQKLKYNQKHPITSLNISTLLKIPNGKPELCSIYLYQPWYYLIPDFILVEIISCRELSI